MLRDTLLEFARNRDVQAAAAIAVILGVIYGVTLCPTVYWYDSAEFAAEAVALGVPHPPGYPLYTMIAHLFSRLGAEPAWGVNVMSATFAVIAAVLLYIASRILDIGRPAAVIAALTLGVGRTFWGNAVVAEVYTPGLAFTLGTLVLLLLGLRRDSGRLVVAAALVAGLGLGMHMSIATCGLGFVWLAASIGLPWKSLPELTRPGSGSWPRRLKVLAGCLGGALLGALVFLYIPIRSLNRWDNERAWINIGKNIAGGTFKLKFLKKYDLGERVDLVVDTATLNLSWVGLALAAVGLGALVWRRPTAAVGLFLAAAGNVYWFFNYNVPDIEVFYLPAVAMATIFFAAGLDAVGRRLGQGLGRHLVWLALGLPVWFATKNYGEVDLSDMTEAKVYGAHACRTLPKGAHIIMYSHPEEWRYFAVFLYTQKALGQCTEVTVSRRSPTKLIRKKLAVGIPVYAFLPIKKFRRSFKLIPEGVLYRVEEAGRRPLRRRGHRHGKRGD